MGTDSKIEWTDHTLNFWIGCTKVSAACDNCYMYRDAKRRGFDPSVVKRTSAATWRQPLVKARSTGEYKWKPGAKVFVCSWSDFFHKDADEWRRDAFNLMVERPDLIWMILTKRPEWAIDVFSDSSSQVTRELIPNLYLGVTVESNEQLWRVEQLLKLRKYAKVLFVSYEPALGELDLKPYLPGDWYCHHCREYFSDSDGGEICSNCDCKIDNDPRRTSCQQCGSQDWDSACPQCGNHSINGYPSFAPTSVISANDLAPALDWVIAGGESGPGARPSHPDWFRKIRDDCQAAGTPFFFKQWGEWFPREEWEHNPELILPDDDYAYGGNGRDLYRSEDPIDGTLVMHRVGKKKAGNLLDGVKHEEWPE